MSVVTPPVYEHDCTACKYVGAFEHESYGQIDLYYCTPNVHDTLLVSYIGRYGHEAHEYLSGHPSECFAEGYVEPDWAKPITEAIKKARSDD